VGLLKPGKIDTLTEGTGSVKEVQKLTIEPGGTLVLSLVDALGVKQPTGTLFLEEGDSAQTAVNNAAQIQAALNDLGANVSVAPATDGFLITFQSVGNKAPLVVESGVGHFERVNYNGSLDSIDLFGLGGDDRFGIDDVRADMTIYGGEGREFFQVGQLYKSKRNAAAGVPNADVFATIETTRGYLSNGISKSLAIYGDDGDDEFVVYHNLAPLLLFGGDGDDSFLIRAFALAGSQEDLRERTDVSGGAGADLIMYAVNAPVNIDGGDGFDTVVVIGTEFNDDFVVTENGVFGAGLNVSFVRIESVEVDGAEGDDRFFIRGTGAEMITKVTGGLGSDTFFTNGATPDVISNDLLGHSGLISHQVSSMGVLDSAYSGLKVEGIAANIADDDEPAIRIIESGGSSIVSQALGNWDNYGVVLTRKPENGATVVVTARAPRGVRFVKKTVNGFDIAAVQPDAMILTFNAMNWDKVQTIVFEADEQGFARIDTTNEGDSDEHEVQVLSVGFTGGSLRLKQGAVETAAINLVIDGNGVKTAQEINADSIEGALNTAFAGTKVSVTGSGPNYIIEFLVNGGETELEVFAFNQDFLRANDIVGTQPGYITHKIAVAGGAQREGDVIKGLFVKDTVPENSRFLKVFGGLPTFMSDQGAGSLRGATIKVIGGSGIGQVRLVIGDNGVDTIETSTGWLTGLDSSSRIEILRYSGVIAPALLVEVVGDDGPGVDVRESDGETFAFEAPQITDVPGGAVLDGLVDTIALSIADAPFSGNYTVTLDGTVNGFQQLKFYDATTNLEVTSFVTNNKTFVKNLKVVAVDDALVEGFQKPRAFITLTGAGTASISTEQQGTGSLMEIQLLDIHATEGSFKLGGQLIAFHDSAEKLAEAIEDALIAGDHNVAVTAEASGHRFVIRFNTIGDKPPLAVTESTLLTKVVRTVVVDVGDNDAPGVMVIQTEGSTDLIEFGDGQFDGTGPATGAQLSDTYKVVLTQAPKAGETVTVNVIAEPTRTQRGAGFFGIRAFTEEVRIAAGASLQFTTANWFNAQTVTVQAVDDDKVDGQDSQSFPTILDLANNIVGPLEITGGMTDDRSADLEREPLMLLGETNFKKEIGSVAAADSFTIRVDLDEVIGGLGSATTLVQGGAAGQTLVATNTDGRTSPPSLSDANEVQVLVIDAVSGFLRLKMGASESANIEFKRYDQAATAAAIKAALETFAGITLAEVTADSGSFLIKFTSAPLFGNLPTLEVLAPNLGAAGLTKTGVFVDGLASSNLDEVIQDLSVFGNAGNIVFNLNGTLAAPVAFDPRNENQALSFQSALQTAANTEFGTGVVTVTVQGTGSLYQVTFDQSGPALNVAINKLVVQSHTLRIDEIQSLNVQASNVGAGNNRFKLRFAGSTTTTDFLDHNISAADLETAVEGLLSAAFGTVSASVEVIKDDTSNNDSFTIIFRSPGNANVAQLEVVAGTDFQLRRYAADAIDVQLRLEDSVRVDALQLVDYTIEITRGDAKNKVRLITDVTNDPLDSSVLILTVDRPWQGGLTRQIPDADSLYTIQDTNPNLLVDENEETDVFYLNDDDSVVSFNNPGGIQLQEGKLVVTADRLTGLGMAPDPQFVGGNPVAGGVKYVGLEELYIDLGIGANQITIKDTHSGATTINAGRGEDTIEIEAISGHTFVNGGPDADSITVTKAGKLDKIAALLTVSGDVPQVMVVTLARGSAAEPQFQVQAVNEIQQYVVEATGGTYRLGFTPPAGGPVQYTADIGYDAAAAMVQAALVALAGIDAGDVVVEKFGPTYRVSFKGALGAKDIALLIADDAKLTSEGPRDRMIVDDSATSSQSLALLKGTSLTGLGMGGVNEVQTLRVDATAGTFKIGYQGNLTAALNHNVSAAGLQTALEGLSGIGTGNVLVERVDDVYVIQFRGTLTNLDVDQLTAHNVNLTLATEAPNDTQDDASAFEDDGIDLVTQSGAIELRTRFNGFTAAAANEVQRLNVAGGAAGDKFSLSFGTPGNVTKGQFILDFTLTAGDLQLAIESLEGIAAGDVKVSEILDATVPSGTRSFRIEFVRELAYQDQPLLVANQLNGLVSLSVAEVTKGLDTAINDVQVVTVNGTGSFTLTIALTRTGLDPLVFTTRELASDVSGEDMRRALQQALAFALTNANATQVISISSATTGSFQLRFNGQTTIQLDPYVSAQAIENALNNLPGLGAGEAYQIDVVDKGNGNFEVEFLGRPFNQEVPLIQVVNENTDGSVITYVQGVREAFKTDFEVAKIGNDYIIGFQGKTRQVEAGPGVGYVVAQAVSGAPAVSVTTRMDGINYYGIETLDLKLGSFADVVNVQGISAGSYQYNADGSLPSMAVIEPSTDGNGSTVPEVQRLTLNAVGSFKLKFPGSATETAAIVVESDNLDAVATAIATQLNTIGAPATVLRKDDRFTITFTGTTNRPLLQIVDISLRPVHAVTNIDLGGNATGSERVFVSSDTNLDRNTITHTNGVVDQFDFLTGNLDGIRGDLNILFGAGRHGLMISDEASIAADSNVVITDLEPSVSLRNRLVDDVAGDNQIWVTGLSFGGIGYSTDTTGNLYDGVVYWTGSGNDSILINGSHTRDPLRTTTILNTGLGDDHVTVDLDNAGDDGFFVLNTMGSAASANPAVLSAGQSDNDTVRSAASTLPLIVFGGIGHDDIIAGQNKDIVFGDFGRLHYMQSGALSGVLGYGGRGDVISDAVIDATWVFSRHLILGGNDIIEGQGDDDVLIGGGNTTNGLLGTDYIDGDSGEDLIFGDAVKLFRRNIDVGAIPAAAITDPRFRALLGQVIYSRTDVPAALQGAPLPASGNVSGEPLVGSAPQVFRSQNDTDGVPHWAEFQIVELYHDDGIGNVVGQRLPNSFGRDYIAGGADHDMIFGQLGNDTIQGDGAIASAVGAESVLVNRIVNPQASLAPAGARREQNGTIDLTPTVTGLARNILVITPSFEAATDGDDYIEGNGGNDVIFGNLGQDDIVGGSSQLYSLNTAARRPDGEDTILGGAGTRIAHDNEVLPINQGSVLLNEVHARDSDAIASDNADIYRLVGTNTSTVLPTNFLSFNYDREDAADPGYSATRKIIARAVKLLDYTPGGPDFQAVALNDRGGADEVHGESGDDFLYGMKGADVIFGDSQDDDIVGGYGNDWISGGTGDDGVLGDDGRIYTSRNSLSAASTVPIGEPLYGIDPPAQINQAISTPGKLQTATINVAGQLKKTVDLTPFSVDPAWPQANTTDEFGGAAVTPDSSDDIIYGGWGNDFLHGGSGDDAISGAEALASFYSAPANPGDVLGYADIRASEFASYDEFDPLRSIATFLLNFNHAEGPLVAGSTTIRSDGNDAIFGDLGNDWLVGGTGKDNLYGGWGDDLLNADDDLSTALGANTSPDTHASYEDRAYGGAGRDVLIGNTGGDRLIDWVGEFNSYIVPFAPFGAAAISRTLQPQLPEFLYALSKADGADPTRVADTGADPLRNGEPVGELGLVLQKDFSWKAQTGAPDDPQAGNIPGGPRDVLRSADFNNAQAQGFVPDTGTWAVTGGRYQVAPATAGGDAVSVFHVDNYIPSYFEMLATINAVRPTAGLNANAYLIFDYQSPTNFKFAGVNVSTNKLEIGRRTAQGWMVDVQGVFPGSIRSDTDYNLFLALNGSNVTLTVNNQVTMTYTFAPRVDVYGIAHGLNEGMVGLGARNARALIDNVAVQRARAATTFSRTVDFATTTTSMFQAPLSGTWTLANGRYQGSAGTSGVAIDLTAIRVASSSLLDLSGTLRVTGEGGFIFDQYSATDFKFVTISAGKVTLGHRTAKGWFVDATYSNATIVANTDYSLGLTLKGSTVSVTWNGAQVLSRAYNALVTDGGFGLFSRTGSTSYDSVTVRSDDPALLNRTFALNASEAGSQAAGDLSLSEEQVANTAKAAIQNWSVVAGIGEQIKALPPITFELVNDLPGNALAWSVGDGTVLIDLSAAGHGWFVDTSPRRDEEFRPVSKDVMVAKAGSSAFGKMDLLTVLEHEIGHALGYVHTTADGNADLMDESLAPGTRIALPGATSHASTIPANVPVVAAFTPDAAWKPWSTRSAQPQSSALAPLIDWKSKTFGDDTKPEEETPQAWIADFLNHAGQSEAQRNPNAGLRIHVPVTGKIAAEVSQLSNGRA
jgi:Ca2+-binding RTX toxin-like protein